MKPEKIKNYIMDKLSRCKLSEIKLLSNAKKPDLNDSFKKDEKTDGQRYKILKNIGRLIDFKSLKTKLLLLNTVTILFVIIIIMIYMIHVSRSNAEENMKNNLKNQSVAAEIILNNEISNIKNLNVNIAKNSAFRMLIQMNLKEQLIQSLQEYMNKYPEINDIIVYKGDTEIYRANEKSNIKIDNTVMQRSGFVQGDHINVYSIEDIVDSNSETIGTIVMLHDITAGNNLIKKISTSLETNAFLYEGNKLVAMSDSNGNAYDNNEDVTIDLESIEKGNEFLSSAQRIFDGNYYLYCKEIKDYQGKTLGVLSVGVTDKSLKELVNEITYNMIGIGLLSLVIGLFLAWIVSVLISTPIKQLVRNVELVQKGDLTVSSDYKSNDEVGMLSNAFYEMVATLKAILTDINEKSLLLSRSSEEINNRCSMSMSTFEGISSAAQDIAQGTNEQVEAVDEAKKQMEVILSDMAKMADFLTETREVSLNAGESASMGDKLVTEALNQMDNINDSILNSNKCLKELGRESDNIFKIIKVISDIASQTHLLAMNATIEAAKAGEAGKGFSVIASEIRKLALKSKDSTVEINKIISDIKTYINKTINIADATIAQSEKGILVVSDAKNAFNMINNNTRDIIEKVNDLVVVTERVVSSSKLFTKSFYQTMEVAESTSASIEEIAASLETQTETMDKITNSSSLLAQSAKDMHELVGKFKIN
ncbi:methyl-accepting chemotaxis sensory transducer with TarH sensor [Acetivibrio thermocellus AD2]|uniref:Methyl-accepting chemotaxis sensory transducer with TarH sensor n=3 Tax=Acetivibrio thermocellus TaxID=1515 RepID=A0AB36TFZ7_ACETH|nr:methyl-accepting chemotaxis protein [Acetivibrio thermocellus]ADU74502.1 methyl-accepting chemotaxis sensory transducer [Acetivibrio thermocellus DSM 1313]ALX08445.1 methyl-accepting chemotaxis sensory transducer [Acetivibrio thermocellus AD2]ANV76194.1 methyl-accepting chemotaxis sensory transducer [Acetivibrio thermocellus DSM 2360]EIC05386.1 chemotaxis sensory transducer [Acetivibrio thermocellus YS]PFH02718.1 methyl-accepting chemotaxis sensory transducer with TarH sensor [Acetivibrio t